MKWVKLTDGREAVLSRERDGGKTYELVFRDGSVSRVPSTDNGVASVISKFKVAYPLACSPVFDRRNSLNPSWLSVLRSKRIADITQLIQSKRRRGRARKTSEEGDGVEQLDGLDKQPAKPRQARKPRKSRTSKDGSGPEGSGARSDGRAKSRKPRQKNSAALAELDRLLNLGQITPEDHRLLVESL